MGIQIRERTPARSTVIPPRAASPLARERAATPDPSRGTAARGAAPQQHGAGPAPGGFGHDFGRVSVYGDRESDGVDAKISASGTSTISIKYTPAASDKSTKIVFIQTVRDYLDGALVKPSELNSSLSFKDAVLTSAYWCVDFVSGEKDPYYNGDDPQDGGTQGNATSKPAVDASMTDTPSYGDGAFPSGKTKTLWEFRTASFSAAGADAGTFYDYVDWTFSKEKGKASSLKVGSSGTGAPGKDFQDAVDAWDKKYGFTLPKVAAAPPPKPAPTPAPGPSATPAPPPGPKP